MRLLHLPAEKVHHICMLLCPHCYPRDLTPSHKPDDFVGCGYSAFGELHHVLADIDAPIRPLNSLSQTCRALHAIAQRILYHDVAPRDAFRLLRTLVANPRLATHVWVLHLGQDRLSRPEAADVPAIEAAAGRLGVRLPPDWTGDSSDEHSGTVTHHMTDLILALTAPKLEALRYTAVKGLGIGGLLTLGNGDEGCVVEFPCLHRLSIVSTGRWRLDGGFRLGRTNLKAFLMAAPELAALTVCRCFSVDPGHPLENIRELYLPGCFLAAEDLANAVMTSPKLESFGYEPARPAFADDDAAVEILPGDDQAVLRAPANLGLGDGGGTTEQPLAPHEWVGMLVGYEAGETRIDMADLLAKAVVMIMKRQNKSHYSEMVVFRPYYPRSVRMLAVASFNRDCVAPIQSAKAKSRGRFPNRMTIGIVAPGSTPEQVDEISSQLRALYGVTAP